MISLILRFLAYFFKPINNLLITSRNSTRNFTLFTVIAAIINLSIKSLLIATFSSVEGSQDYISYLVYFVRFITFSMFIPVLVFYGRSNHSEALKKNLSKLIDFDRIEENAIRQKLLVKELIIQFPNTRFSPAFLSTPIFFVYILYVFKVLPSWLEGLIVLFLWISAILLIWYIINRQRVWFKYAEIPDELLYIPSKIEKSWWDLKFITWEELQNTLWGGNRTKSTNFDAEYSRRKWKSISRPNKSSWFIGGVVATGAIVGGYIQLESHFYLYPAVYPSAQLFSSVVRGYYTDNAVVLERSYHLRSSGCDMSTFCYPGTKELDHRAVNEAYTYIENNPSLKYESRAWVFTDVPAPVGPYLSIVGGKECSVTSPVETTSTVENKEFYIPFE